MGSNNDYCERCHEQPYYDGHKDWCAAILALEDRIEELEAQLDITIRVNEEQNKAIDMLARQKPTAHY